jgi:hypothetical protein
MAKKNEVLNEVFTVTITPQGEATIDVTGSDGVSCQETTKALEAALGSETGAKLIRRLKSEALNVLKNVKRQVQKVGK